MSFPKFNNFEISNSLQNKKTSQERPHSRGERQPTKIIGIHLSLDIFVCSRADQLELRPMRILLTQMPAVPDVASRVQLSLAEFDFSLKFFDSH